MPRPAGVLGIGLARECLNRRRQWVRPGPVVTIFVACGVTVPATALLAALYHAVIRMAVGS